MEKHVKADIKEMKRLLRKTKDTVMYRKYQSVLLHMKGHNNTKTAELVEVDRKTSRQIYPAV
jgi:tRNA(Phe) wybutosine-synthesizing methylase Tyw3